MRAIVGLVPKAMLVLSALLLLPAAARAPTITARTIHVDCTNDTGVEDGTEANPFNTIQEGIDAAIDGDTVLVHPCAYCENIDFLGRAITVASTDPLDPSVVETTVMDGGAAGSVVTFANSEGEDSVLCGFTIRNGTGTPVELIPDLGPRETGGGIFCHGSSPTISDNIITANDAFEAAGIFCYQSSSPTISDNVIAGNTAAHLGGGILCVEFSSPTITTNAISGNSAQMGGAMYCYQSSPTMADNAVAGNTTQLHGAGILCDHASPTMTHNTIVENVAGGGGGGGIWCYESSPTISTNTIARNAASIGGGIWCGLSSPVISHNTIADNSADGEGGGINCSQSSPVISNNTLTENNAGNHGGAIYCHSSSPTISHNTIAANSALECGGGVYCRYNSSPAVSNNIVALNSSGIWQEEADPGAPTLRNNCVHNPDGYDYSGLDPGIGDISLDPLLVDIAGGDLHLTAPSPCIDAGWNYAPGAADSDIDGDLRPSPPGGVVDMGADEWVPSPLRFCLRGGCWHLITIPCHPLTADPWEVFDELRPPNKPLDLLSGCLHRYDHAEQGYVTYYRRTPTDFGPMTTCDGYWLWLFDDETIAYEAECSGEGESIHFATAGWHLIGSPHVGHTYADDSEWYQGVDGPYPFSAIMNLWVQDPLIYFPSVEGGYRNCGLLRTDDDDHLRAFSGYWLYTFVDDVTLEIPPG